MDEAELPLDATALMLFPRRSAVLAATAFRHIRRTISNMLRQPGSRKGEP